MNRALRRRLDVLIVLCSTLLGVGLTVLFFWQQVGLSILFFAVVPTGFIVLLAHTYVVVGPPASDEEQADS